MAASANWAWAPACCASGSAIHESAPTRRGFCLGVAGGFLVAALQCLPAVAFDKDRMLAAAKGHGPLAVAGVQALQTLVNSLRTAPEPHKLAAVNRFFNERIRFAEDMETTGQVDQWASPLETLSRGAGDCEDYAIAKFFTLMVAGVPGARMRLVYVRADVAGLSQAHMVLACYPQPSAEPLILDNLRPDIVLASARRDLTPVFSFNAEGLWQGTAGPSAGDPTERLSRWREVVAKARAEGFL